jgi:hypothetical protein
MSYASFRIVIQHECDLSRCQLQIEKCLIVHHTAVQLKKCIKLTRRVTAKHRGQDVRVAPILQPLLERFDDGCPIGKLLPSLKRINHEKVCEEYGATLKFLKSTCRR